MIGYDGKLCDIGLSIQFMATKNDGTSFSRQWTPVSDQHQFLDCRSLRICSSQFFFLNFDDLHETNPGLLWSVILDNLRLSNQWYSWWSLALWLIEFTRHISVSHYHERRSFGIIPWKPGTTHFKDMACRRSTFGLVGWNSQWNMLQMYAKVATKNQQFAYWCK